jgi:REP element-mobilizing transposase RayT
MPRQQPIIGYHLVFGAYGFWLPNDPRGSWSKNVWASRLVRFGPPRPARTPRSLAKVPHDRAARLAAKRELQRPAVRFNDRQIRIVAEGLAEIVANYNLPTFAAAVMPDHVHLVIARQAQTAEAWTGYFKRAASRLLRSAGLHPFADYEDDDGGVPTMWADGGWKVFLHDDHEMRHAIEYVERNPIVAGRRAQAWPFITPYRIGRFPA